MVTFNSESIFRFSMVTFYGNSILRVNIVIQYSGLIWYLSW